MVLTRSHEVELWSFGLIDSPVIPRSLQQKQMYVYLKKIKKKPGQQHAKARMKNESSQR